MVRWSVLCYSGAMSTKRYSHAVTVPFVGSIIATIQSDDPKPSPNDIAKAVALMCKRMVLETDTDGFAEVHGWTTIGDASQGNVSHLPCDTATIDDTEDHEDEDED